MDTPPSSGAPARPGRPSAKAAAALLFAALALVYLVLLQPHPYGDGITYIDYALDGKLWFHHLAYLPSLWGFVHLAEAIGVAPQRACFAFSALAGAGAGALLYLLLRTARTFRVGAPALPLALLLASAPSVLFFSTQVENHAWHLFWVAGLLLVLDRALADLRLGPWLVAGAVLVLAYASHSSILLLFPALALCLRHYWAGGLLRPLGLAEILRQGLLFGPTLMFKFVLEPAIKASAGGEAFAKDTSLGFALSLWEPRGASWWLDYIPSELLAPAFGIWLVVLAFALGARSGRGPLGILLFGWLCYLALFGFWPVHERGAYYLALLPLSLCLCGPGPEPQGRLFGWTRQRLTLGILVLVGLQALVAVLSVERWNRNPDAPWVLAAEIAGDLPADTTVLCVDGVVHLHLKRDRGMASHPLANWYLTWKGDGSNPPSVWQRLADVDLPPLLDGMLAKGPVFVTDKALRYLQDNADLRPIQDMLGRRYRLRPAGTGRGRGVFLER